MMWLHKEREITQEQYEKIQAGRMNEDDLFSECERCGYGATPLEIYKRDDKYYVFYGISDSCD